MNWTRIAVLSLFVCALSVGSASAQSVNVERQRSPAGLMLNKLGRGVVNVVTSWVEIPRNIAVEWERTDPVTGVVMGSVKGIGWGFARLVTGVYETVTFPFPIPAGYGPLIEPEFIVTDIWGDHIPYLTDFRGNDPEYPAVVPVYPHRFNY